MRDRDARHFTGRQEQLRAFEKILYTVEHNLETQYQNVKTAIAISGEGGMGKTSILREFERICERQKVQKIYLDMRRREEPKVISNIVDFLRVLRIHFKRTIGMKLLGQNPFEEFDRQYKRYTGLEEKLIELKRKNSPDLIESLSDLGAQATVGLGKQLVVGKALVGLLGEERVENTVEAVIRGSIDKGRDMLLRIFGKAEDVEFFKHHEEVLIEKFIDGMNKNLEDKPLVMLIDSYEDVIDIDIELRERLFQQFAESVIIILAGRNNIYDNSNLGWRDETLFIEMREFDDFETTQYLTQRGIGNEELSRAVYTFTNGVPLAVATAVDIIKRIEDEKAAFALFCGEGCEPRHAAERNRIIEEVTERFLDQVVEAEERELIYLCAILGEFDWNLLSNIFQKELSEESIERIVHYSFIRRSDQCYFMHETVREFVLRSVKRSKPDAYKNLHERAIIFFEQHRNEIKIGEEPYENEQWRAHTAKIVYHRLQAERETGINNFYHVIADASWEAQVTFSLELLDILQLPIPIQLASSEFLRTGYKALLERDIFKTLEQFEALLTIDEQNIHFKKFVHDELGESYANNNIQQYQKAIKHFQEASHCFEKLGEKDKAAWTFVNIAVKCYRKENKYQEAVENLTEALERYKIINNQGQIVCVLEELGHTYKEWGKYENAISYYQEILQHYKLPQNEEQIARVYWWIGDTYRKSSKYGEAVEQLTRSRDLYERLNYTEEVAHLLRSIGDTYHECEKHEDAIAHYQEALKRYEVVQDEKNVSLVNYLLGIEYRTLQRYEEAVGYFINSRKIDESLNQVEDVAYLWRHLGDTYLEWGEHKKAITHYQEALTRFKMLQNEMQVALLHWWIGDTYRKLSKYGEAIEQLTCSRDLFEKLNHRDNIVRLWQHLGDTYQEWEKHEEAVTHYQEALKRYEVLQDEKKISLIHYRLGIVYRGLNKYKESVEHLTHSREINENLEQAENIAALWRHLGDTYQQWEKHEDAIVHYQGALKHYKTLQDEKNVSLINYFLGIEHRTLQRYEEAVGYLTHSREINEKLEQAEDIALLWRHLGDTYQEWEKHEKAVIHYQEALKRCEVLQDEKEISWIHYRLGIAHRELNKYKESVEHLTHSREINEKLEQTENVALLWLHLGDTYQQWEKHEDAIAHYQEALSRFEILEDKAMMAEVLLRFGQAYRECGKLEDSQEKLTKSFYLYEELQQQEDIVNLFRHQAITLTQMKKYVEAEQKALEGLRIAEIQGLKLQSGWCHETLIEVYGNWQKMEFAREQYRKVIELYERLMKYEDIADAKQKLGQAEYIMGNYDTARQLFDEALNTYRSLTCQVKAARTLRELGQIYQAMNKREQAGEVLQESLSLFEEMTIKSEVAKTRKLIIQVTNGVEQ